MSILISSTETLIFAEGAPDLTILGRRTAALQKLARGEARLVVGPIGAFLQRAVAPEALRDRSVRIAAGGKRGNRRPGEDSRGLWL